MPLDGVGIFFFNGESVKRMAKAKAQTKRGKTTIVPIGLRGTVLDHARGSRCGAAIDLEETFR